MFFSTQKNHGMYSILTKSILLHYKKKFKINSDINYFTKKNLSITFFLFFIYHVLILLIFRNKEKFLYLKYKNCEIGRHVTSTVFRDATSYKSKFYLTSLLFLFIMGLWLRTIWLDFLPGLCLLFLYKRFCFSD